MKKTKRWIAFLLVFALCLPLCGCSNLDEMRAAHAFWQKDGSVLWNGNVYRLIEDVPEDLAILYGQQEVYVTQADVPVLLSQMMGDCFSVVADETMLWSHGWDGGRVFYCREDVYDFMTEHLKNPSLTTYYYTYWADTDADEAYYYLSEAQGNTIDELIATLDFVVLDETFYHAFEANEFCLTLGKCDEEHLFSNDYVVEIAWKDGLYYIISPNEYIAEVPNEYNDAMKSIVSVYYNAEVKPYL